eukprot:COSAG01_NODE_1560_length_9921_cov_30.121551_8_plen_67_part_00
MKKDGMGWLGAVSAPVMQQSVMRGGCVRNDGCSRLDGMQIGCRVVTAFASAMQIGRAGWLRSHRSS